MTIEIWAAAGDFINKHFPEATGETDLEKSHRNFERMLEDELTKTYPFAEVTVRVVESGKTAIYLDSKDIGLTDEQSAANVHANIRSAMDKLFFYGRFWEDKRPRE